MAAYGSPGSGSSNFQSNRHNFATIPTTIRYLEKFWSDGRLYDLEKSNYCLIGKIRELNATPSCLEFVLDDSTGLRRCTWYQPPETTWNVGNYVRVYGDYKGDHIAVFMCKHLTTKNEITHHILSVIKAHRTLSAAKNMKKNLFANPAGEQEVQQVGQNSEMADPFLQRIEEYIKNQGSPKEGISVETILKDIGNGKAPDYRRGIQQMIDSGALYETGENCFALS